MGRRRPGEGFMAMSLGAATSRFEERPSRSLTQASAGLAPRSLGAPQKGVLSEEAMF